MINLIKRGQVALEFLFFIGLAMLLGIILLYMMNHYLSDELGKRTTIKLENVADDIQKELVLASEVHSGYSRMIYIPESYNYSIIPNNNFLILRYDYQDITLRIPTINGTLKKGNNTIRNVEGLVIVEN